jgi:hypothetical protein
VEPRASRSLAETVGLREIPEVHRIANTKRLVNEASLPPDVEIRARSDACMNSVKRRAAQERIKALLEQGLQQPGDLQNRLGFFLGHLGLNGER